MAYTIDYGYTRSQTTKNVAVALPVYTNFSEGSFVENKKADQITRTWNDLTSPTDRHHTCTLWKKGIENIYIQTDINPLNQSPIKGGFQLGLKDEAIAKISETDDSLASGLTTSCCSKPDIYGPSDVEIRINNILHPAIDAAFIRQRLLDVVNKYFPEDDTSADQINLWIHGSLTFKS